ncbi:SIR2 family protein [Allorhodopirellula heiligendammensis]|uniref:Uncharacterized protein n=1 Tax=Allorhodopirellula heiligendammensis TaxID=2714739 RepID=A0A5C6BF49_9BACT|nr:SIR2 family protein [Allorhodopirellula heiligendammensis]TWU10530.1 hypothetical protein Poly21_44350 [Allorhodopirellula heiligendammensis]
MRFIDGGPALPDTLLRARDEGRVVFFCGAGVSRARAGLADFFGLAESVIRELGALADSDAAKVLQKAKQIGKELDVTGLISADRVFSLLERDFDRSDIQAAVAKSLTPAADVNRSAHEILLRLARTPSGKTQLVTTNFDRLFEADDVEIQLFQPPRLPQPSRYDDLDGIVYLHGRVDTDCKQEEGNGFVLSSSDFGHAYLSDGWATEFFREIVRKYVVVFVGYSADDPPVHYLLEGLRRNPDSLNGIYAFQSDESAELTARWQHKGVIPIAYSDAEEHHALWETLGLWAIRADDPQKWRESILDLAMAGPKELKPHQRGQIAHIVSTYDGAEAFAESVPPAEWLCVLDPSCRYEPPGHLIYVTPDSARIDPFIRYGLDSDEIPQRSGGDSFNRKREVPTDAWDAFTISELDQQDLSPNNLPAVRGNFAVNVAELPARLLCFARWIANVANQPAAVWWAVRQESLHPSYRGAIEWRLSRIHEDEVIDVEIQRVWNYLLEAWNDPPRDADQDWFELEQAIKRNGWSINSSRRFVKLSEPYLKVGPALMSRPVPPAAEDGNGIIDFVSIEAECPVPPIDSDIPVEWLAQTVRGLRYCLEAATRLCEEVNDHQRHRISPIERDLSPKISDYGRTRDLSGCVIAFASLYERLVAADPQRAREEFAAWPSDECTAFARLRFWASGKPEIATPDAFAQVVLGLTDNVFWGSHHQRDLLITLAKRWTAIAAKIRIDIETRILSGPSRYEGEDEDSYREHVAWSVLDRLQWLKTHGCEFSFDAESEIASRKPDAPNWKPQCAERAAESRETRSGSVATNTEHSALVREPISSILSKARELSGRSDTDNFRENNPFAGLCSKHSRRAYLALAKAARRHAYPPWAWTTFLNCDSRENDRPAFSAVVATRLCRATDEVLSELLYLTACWLQKVSKAIRCFLVTSTCYCGSPVRSVLDRLDHRATIKRFADCCNCWANYSVLKS